MKNVKEALEVLALFAYALITIATCSAAWSSGQGTFYYVVAAVLMAVNGYIIYRKARRIGK